MTEDSPRLTRRRWCLGVVAMAAGGCASLISPQHERQLGQEEAEEFERATGLVRDPGLVAYVRQVGERLASGAAHAVAWEFRVADDPAPNAFALPGGFVYLTRGLLALANREDDLAGVIAHEMGHVLERHSVRRATAASPFAILFGVPAAILDRVSPAAGSVLGGAGRLASSLALASYDRDQEREADRVAVALSARAGWDPRGLAALLRTLEREDALGGRPEGRPGFFSTHPSTPERVASIEAGAAALGSPAPPLTAAARAAFLAKLDGLLVGENPAHGVLVGSRLVHPELDLAADLPPAWTTGPVRRGVAALAPDRTAVLLLAAAGEADDPVQAARNDGVPERLVAGLRRAESAGLPAARLVADTREGDRLDLTWVVHARRVLRVMALASIPEWSRHRPVFEQVVGSVRPLGPAERARITETRLRIQPARAGERMADLVERTGGVWEPARVAVANGVAADVPLEAGWPVKVPLRQPRAPVPRAG
jgi:predicted Zn-dependent protease